MPIKKTLGVMTALALAANATAQVAQLRMSEDSLSIMHVDIENVKKGMMNNALDALSGQVAGVNVSTNGMDRMAMLSSVRVRGTTSVMGGNDPLVVIDGVPSDASALASLYPADIESFTILKNAAETSLYGSRGASGVIEVKTKKGTGRGFQISYEGNYGVEAMYKHLRMLSASEYLAVAKERGVFAKDGGSNTDFFDAMTRTAFVQNHYLAFSGGTEQSNYRASLGYLDHNSILRGKGSNQFIAKIDVTQKAFGDRLVGEFGVVGSSTKQDGLWDTQSLFYAAAGQNPTFAYEENSVNEGANSFDPPYRELGKQNDTKELHFNTHLQLSYKLSDALSLTAFGAYVYASNENDAHDYGSATRMETKKEEWLGNIAAKFNKTWDIHALAANVSMEYQTEKASAFWTKGSGISVSGYGYDNLGVAGMLPYGSSGSSNEDQSLLSFMGNANYTLLNRYTLLATARFDGSSMVGNNNTWAFFPSVSLSWDVKKEPWLRDVRPISMFTLRTGIGQSGNLGGISAYTTLNTYQPTGMVSYNSVPTVTLGILRNSNPDLKWETKTSFNIGADLGFWDNRLVLTAEYYYSKTTDMLYAYDVPVPTYAFDKMLANMGSMRNTGFELGFSITPIAKRDVELNINTNWAFESNRLLSLSGDYNGMHITADKITALGGINGAGQHGGYNNVVYQMVGQPLGVFYLPHCTGLYTDEYGTTKYQLADLDGDGAVNLSDGGDRYVAGQATPKVTMGSNISFRYKDWYLSLQVNGAFGHKIFNATGLSYSNMSSFPTYNVLKGAPERNIVDQNVSDYWLESGDYVNFESLTVGYNVPLRSKVVRSLRLSASINNLGTISAYSGLTPLINSYVVNSTIGLDDKRNYPLSRTYSIGVQIHF